MYSITFKFLKRSCDSKCFFGDAYRWNAKSTHVQCHNTLARKGEILEKTKKIWLDYQLDKRTHFNYTVQKLTPEGRKNGSGSKWTINDGEEGFFDGVIVAIGSCDKPNRIFFEGSQDFQGKLVHSSQLDGLNWKGKRVVVIGGGASAVEALELAVKSQCTTPAVMITRTDKWFLPRGFLFSFFVSSIPYGRDCFPFRIFEKYLKTFHYQNHLKWMIPLEKDGKTQASLYGKTPIVNSNFLKLVRTGTANYVRAHVMKISGEGVEVRRFLSDKSDIIGADIIVEATGYHRPKVSFLESEGLFSGPKGSKQYSPPNVFLQAFLVPDWRCAMPNAAFVEGAASVGHFHIGILARLMMMFMMDSSTAPSPEEMSRWVNEKIKFKGSLIYWTYSEQLKWYLQFLLSSFRRSRWIIFVLFGWGRTGNRLYAPLR
ncbi:hypothetical protein O181_047838 [Austropuccinia psidii MF-1]|uniref:L-ornithine N(5)-oxygenase n=1 Tax=Austropuccinia psidii MF-1 TaxID=1389203 RepID=A0A9Q3DWU0_9BASI|nr:hypothetical protein [Austropuccinia psidii MF-1]